MKEVLLILFLCLTKGYTECPSGCSCTANSVLCVNKGLTMVPNLNSLDTSPATLDFSGNKLLVVGVEDFNFMKSDEVIEIYLNNSGIAEIEFGAFQELENLQTLYLAQNLLSTISETIIEQLDGMVLLDISNNYFNGDMPIIRSKSLEVLLLANSKVTNVPQKALKHLPNLKLLLLEQNNIQTLSVNVFEKYVSNALSVKLSFNSWKCNCDNIKTFEFLDNKNLINPSEPYKCNVESNEMINIFGNGGAIENMSQYCNSNLSNELEASFPEIRAMIDEERKEPNNLQLEETNLSIEPRTLDYDYEEYENKELDVKKMSDKELENALPSTCWESVTNAYSNNDKLFITLLIATLLSFFLGFIGGVIFCKILYTVRYKKLEQSSDSQVQLLDPEKDMVK